MPARPFWNPRDAPPWLSGVHWCVFWMLRHPSSPKASKWVHGLPSPTGSLWYHLTPVAPIASLLANSSFSFMHRRPHVYPSSSAGVYSAFWNRVLATTEQVGPARRGGSFSRVAPHGGLQVFPCRRAIRNTRAPQIPHASADAGIHQQSSGGPWMRRETLGGGGVDLTAWSSLCFVAGCPSRLARSHSQMRLHSTVRPRPVRLSRRTMPSRWGIRLLVARWGSGGVNLVLIVSRNLFKSRPISLVVHCRREAPGAFDLFQ